MGAPDSGSPLVRLLGEWNPVDAQASQVDFAERVSQWLNAIDAIGLQAAHQAMRALDAGPAGAHKVRGKDAGSLAQDLQRVRGMLARAIAQPIPATQDDSGFAPYLDRHLELQRQMQMMIAPLRAHVRETARRQSARLRQLAILDAAIEHMLARREQALLPAGAALLKRRFEQLRASTGGDEGRSDALQAFGREWRQALMAELEVRLAPVEGLVQASANEWDDE